MARAIELFDPSYAISTSPIQRLSFGGAMVLPKPLALELIIAVDADNVPFAFNSADAMGA